MNLTLTLVVSDKEIQFKQSMCVFAISIFIINGRFSREYPLSVSMNYDSSSHHSSSSFSAHRFANILYTLSGSTRQGLLICILVKSADKLVKVAELKQSLIICGASISKFTKCEHSELTQLNITSCSHGEYIYCASTLLMLDF